MAKTFIPVSCLKPTTGALALFWCLVGSSCAPEEETLDPSESITVGILLPFTGPGAATASNFERAAHLAAESINESGGIGGKKIRLVAQDTHSDPAQSIKSVRRLIDEGAVAVIGPESPEVAMEILPELNEAEVALISPLVGEGSEQDVDCDFPWFRLSPSAKSLGENLAKEMSAAGYDEVAVLYGEGDYNTAFRSAFVDKFTGAVIQGSVLAEAKLSEGASSYSHQIREVLRTKPDAIVLSTSPASGSLVVNEAGFLGADDVVWGLSPLLKTPLFIQNVEEHFVEGAIGVAPKIFDQSEEFPSAFKKRWQDKEPLEGAFFFYDAIGLLTISLGLIEDVDDFGYPDLILAMAKAASTRGEAIGWNELGEGVRRAEEGVAVSYSGLTGPMVMKSCGDRRAGVTRQWKVQDGQIVDILDSSEK